MLSPKDFQELYMSVYEGIDREERELRRELVADKRASKMEPKVGAKYAGSEAKSAERADKKSKGKHIHGYAIDEASFVYGGEKKEPEDKRMTVTAADKKANTPAYQKFKAGDKRYKAAPHLGEAKDDSYLETDMNKRQKNNEKAIADMKKTKAHADMVKAARKHFDEEVEIEEGKQTFPYKKVAAKIKSKLSRSVYAKTDNPPVPNTTDAEKKATTQMSKMARVYNQTKRADQEKAKANRSSTFYRDTHPASAPKMKKTQREELELQLRAHLRERALDAAEKKEKESVFKAIKPSKLAKSYPEKSPEQLKSLRYAISTAQAKKNMDTSRSDKRYGVER